MLIERSAAFVLLVPTKPEDDMRLRDNLVQLLCFISAALLKQSQSSCSRPEKIGSQRSSVFDRLMTVSSP